MPNSSEHPHRNFRGDKAVTVYAEAVHRVLRAEFQPLKHAAKILARMAGTTPRTAENWLGGLCAPQGAHLIRLMASCDPLKAEIDRLVEEAKCGER